jgi:hypothetical protein
MNLSSSNEQNRINFHEKTSTIMNPPRQSRTNSRGTILRIGALYQTDAKFNAKKSALDSEYGAHI